MKDYETESAKLLYQYGKSTETSLKGPLYHYTKQSVLESILKKRQFWFTDYRYLNDPMEVMLAHNVIRETIKDFCKKSRFKPVFWNNFLDMYLRFISPLSIYTFSFCEKQDHLPAWRWYGDNGVGYALGFRKGYFQADSIPTDTEAKIALLKIDYEEEDFTKKIRGFLPVAERTLHRAASQLEDEEFNNFICGQLCPSFASYLLPLTPGFKDPGYREENEFRLCQFELKVGDQYYPHEIPNKFKISEKSEKPEKPELTSSQPACIKMDCINSSEIPRAHSPGFDHRDVCEIWVGPRLDFDCAKKGIQKILHENGYDEKNVEIKPSRAPYRG
jgi:hypothetical protein